MQYALYYFSGEFLLQMLFSIHKQVYVYCDFKQQRAATVLLLLLMFHLRFNLFTINLQ